ncbi:MAG: hypothetical protein JOY69_03230 [Candidatus Eremiobacteraeota bacterium]|nr:hypothetical protein [Candidatus Eremiobacteraeota bacterium]
MTDVRLQRNLTVPPVPAFNALGEILHGIATQDGHWRGFALHLALGDLHLSDFGYVAVPIALTLGKPHLEAHAVDVSFRAARNPASFPTFNGSMGIDAVGPSDAILWLGGGYDVPLHVFGKLIDVTLAAGGAQRTLENFVADIAAACEALVEKRESQYARYRMFDASVT